MDNLDQLVASATADFAAATEPAKLEDAKARYLGKEGSLTALLKGLGKLPAEERKTAGAAINVAKEHIESALTARREALKNPQLEAQLATEALDVTLPGRGLPRGGLPAASLAAWAGKHLPLRRMMAMVGMVVTASSTSVLLKYFCAM